MKVALDCGEEDTGSKETHGICRRKPGILIAWIWGIGKEIGNKEVLSIQFALSDDGGVIAASNLGRQVDVCRKPIWRASLRS